ncbi:unnamed protein product, partial [Prorocentrum cordatum]
GLQLTCSSIHDHGLTREQVNTVCEQIDLTRARVAADPLRYMATVQGDLNFGPDKARELCELSGRFFCSVPGWMICRVHMECMTTGELEGLSREFISDRAALVATARQRAGKPRGERPAPGHIFAGPLFKKRAKGMVKDGRGAVATLAGSIYQGRIKETLKEAARE